MNAGLHNEVVIRVAGLTKRFGDLVAVADLDLEIYKGEIFGFLGPNGAGKSTSIHMICGLLKPDAGEILLNGMSAGREIRHRSRFGLCPQEVIVWPRLTCLEQLCFMGEMYDMTASDARQSGKRLLELLGLSAKTNALASTLSGGMKRRLNICLALVHHPEVVVLDEPEAGLDPQSRILVRDFIRSLRKNKTVILTTHNMDEADRLSDRVAIIDNGRLMLTDTPENLKKTAGTGDILEISLLPVQGRSLQEALFLLNAREAEATLGDDCIRVRKQNAIEHISVITSRLHEAGFSVAEIKLRSNTLEDVFIQLTGKGLRE
jgi:ABC-2 type transport system ATP-binding protein